MRAASLTRAAISAIAAPHFKRGGGSLGAISNVFADR